MPSKEELILENELLAKKLALAEAWMRREVAGHKRQIGEKGIKGTQRKKLHNILELESIDMITRRMRDQFGDALDRAPEHALEHLIDAEIYWQTLQRFPTLDALPVVSSYQKILDAFFEERLSRPFRQSVAKAPTIPPVSGLDTDIAYILTKRYSLSLGRWYQFFEKVKEGKISGFYEKLLLEYLTSHHSEFIQTCTSDPFFPLFSELISLEVFGRKRHDKKISYADARRVKENSIGILKIIFV